MNLLTGRRILLVEDEVLIACLLGDMLEDLGCVVVGPATRVEQALNLVSGESFDAAVLDVSLNDVFSYPVADALLARGIPFVFSTGYDRDRLQADYQALPMLQKPFHLKELGRAMEALFLTADSAAGHAASAAPRYERVAGR